MKPETNAIIEVTGIAHKEPQVESINLGAYLAIPMILIILSVLVGPVKSMAKHFQSQMKDV